MDRDLLGTLRVAGIAGLQSLTGQAAVVSTVAPGETGQQTLTNPVASSSLICSGSCVGLEVAQELPQVALMTDQLAQRSRARARARAQCLGW